MLDQLQIAICQPESQEAPLVVSASFQIFAFAPPIAVVIILSTYS